MQDLFLQILNMSISASYLILAAVAFRFIFKKAPKVINYLMWSFVGIRLLCPFSLDSVLSLLPTSETFTQNSITGSLQVQTGSEYINVALNEIANQTVALSKSSMSVSEIVTIIFAVLWSIVMMAMVVYSIKKYIEIRSKIKDSALLCSNVYRCDAVESPFILGIIKPKIYVPSNISESDLAYVIAHEKTHLKHFDHIIKPIAYFSLCVHWFNPLAWLAFNLLSKDIELSCDESVVKSFSTQDKKAYSFALINCSSVKNTMTISTPLAFGETSVKTRIKAVLSYKKPKFRIIVVSLVCCLAIGVLLLTNPVVQVSSIEEVITSDIGSIESYNNFNTFEIRAKSYISSFYMSAYANYEMPTNTNYGGNDVSLSSEIELEVIEKFEQLKASWSLGGYDTDAGCSISSTFVLCENNEDTGYLIVQVQLIHQFTQDGVQMTQTYVEQVTLNNDGEIIEFETISEGEILKLDVSEIETTVQYIG